MRVVAIIPARGGSQGIKDKNIQLIAGETLVGRTVRSALEGGFEEVYILTDSPKIRKEAEIAGANGAYVRPSDISGPTSHMFKVYRWFFEEMLRREGKVPDYFCALLPTTPFRNIETISTALKDLQSGAYDWVLSVNEFEHHPYRAMRMTEDQMLSPFFDVDRSILWSNRQELPPMYRFNGGIIAGKVEHVLNHNEYNISYNTELAIKSILMSKEESVDIDDPIDLELCRLMAGDYDR